MNQRYFERSEDYKGSQTYQKVVNYGKWSSIIPGEQVTVTERNYEVTQTLYSALFKFHLIYF